MYKPKLMLIACLIVAIAVLLIVVNNVTPQDGYLSRVGPVTPSKIANVATVASTPDEIKLIYADSPINATYMIDGMAITLDNGVSEFESAPGSTSKIKTRYFGNDVRIDLDGDGRDDDVFLLTQETGGSGTFYYVVAALNTDAGYIGSEGLLLGDRIAPQTTGVVSGNVILVNYADRKPGESFAVKPSVGKSIWLKLDPKTMQFGEVPAPATNGN